MTFAPLRVVCAVSRLHVIDAWHSVTEIWHASTAHHGHHTAKGVTRDEALRNLKAVIEAARGHVVELEVI